MTDPQYQPPTQFNQPLITTQGAYPQINPYQTTGPSQDQAKLQNPQYQPNPYNQNPQQPYYPQQPGAYPPQQQYPQQGFQMQQGYPQPQFQQAYVIAQPVALDPKDPDVRLERDFGCFKCCLVLLGIFSGYSIQIVSALQSVYSQLYAQ
jgi:hypothetical protein